MLCIFMKYLWNGEMSEYILSFDNLKATTGADIFERTDTFFSASDDLGWRYYADTCADGAKANQCLVSEGC